MAKFCSKECEETGSVCDFCKYYMDESQLNPDVGYGEGTCCKTLKRVEALDGHNCNNFICFLVDED